MDTTRRAAGGLSRRDFLAAGAGAAAGLALGGCAQRDAGRAPPFAPAQAAPAPAPAARAPSGAADPRYEIGLCQWAYHERFYRGELDALQFPARVARAHRVAGIDWVNTLLMRPGQTAAVPPRDAAFFAALRRQMDAAGLRSALLLVDLEGPPMGAASPRDRQRFVDAALAWVEPARALGCAGLRVNAHSEFEGPHAYPRALDACSESLERLLGETRASGLLVLVENHGELSSRGDWLADLLRRFARSRPHSGALADLGNWLPFRLTPELREAIGRMLQERGSIDAAGLAPLFAAQGVQPYPALQGMREIAPYTRAVSAKAHRFDAAGNEPEIDYPGQLGILRDAGFRGWISAEYEGSGDPALGSEQTLALLRRTLEELERGSLRK